MSQEITHPAAEGETDAEKLGRVIGAAARQAVSEGVGVSDRYGGETHLWARRNIRYRPETEFFVVFLLSNEMAKLVRQLPGE